MPIVTYSVNLNFFGAGYFRGKKMTHKNTCCPVSSLESSILFPEKGYLDIQVLVTALCYVAK